MYIVTATPASLLPLQLQSFLRLHNRHLAAHWNIRSTTRLRETGHLDPLSEEQTMRTASKVEHSRLLSLGDMITLLDGDFTRADFIHTHTDERHETNGGIIRFDEYDGAGGQSCQVALTHTDSSHVNLGGFAKSFEERLGEVCSVLHESSLDGAADGSVPAVVAQC